MAIITVKVRSKHGLKAIDIYAYLDPGSSVTFCSEDLMHHLGTGENNQDSSEHNAQLETLLKNIIKDLEVCDMDMNNEIELSTVHSQDKMPVSKIYIPTTDDSVHWPHLEHNDLPHIDSNIDLLIGNNVPDAYSPIEVVGGPRGTPHL